MKKIQKSIVMLLVLLLSISSFTITTYAANKKILNGKTIKTYVLTSQNNTPVYSSSKYSDNKKVGTIYASDLITISKISDERPHRIYVTYPISGTNKTKSGWIDSCAVTKLGNGEFYAWVTTPKWLNTFGGKATKKLTTYKRQGKTEYLGYISKGDLVTPIDEYSSQSKSGIDVQIIYPISGGYKMGWIKRTDCEKNLKY